MRYNVSDIDERDRWWLAIERPARFTERPDDVYVVQVKDVDALADDLDRRLARFAGVDNYVLADVLRSVLDGA